MTNYDHVASLYQDLKDGNSISDGDLVLLNSFLKRTSESLMALGPDFRLAWKEVYLQWEATTRYLESRRQHKMREKARERRQRKELTPVQISAARKKEPKEQQCPDGLLPDGEICPDCGGRRGPSGVDGGTWVHY